MSTAVLVLPFHTALTDLLVAAGGAHQDEQLGDMHDLCCLSKSRGLWNTVRSQC